MNFQHRDGWYVTFSLLPDQKPLRRRLTFKATEKLFELARRTGASAEVLADLHRCITAWGRGTATLHLTDAQLQGLGGVR